MLPLPVLMPLICLNLRSLPGKVCEVYLDKITIQTTMLIILDGWGIAPAWGGNAVEMAQTPNIDRFWRKYPHTILRAAEEAVGLPRHEPGNSEVGHLNL